MSLASSPSPTCGETSGTVDATAEHVAVEGRKKPQEEEEKNPAEQEAEKNPAVEKNLTAENKHQVPVNEASPMLFLKTNWHDEGCSAEMLIGLGCKKPSCIVYGCLYQPLHLISQIACVNI